MSSTWTIVVCSMWATEVCSVCKTEVCSMWKTKVSYMWTTQAHSLETIVLCLDKGTIYDYKCTLLA